MCICVGEGGGRLYFRKSGGKLSEDSVQPKFSGGSVRGGEVLANCCRYPTLGLPETDPGPEVRRLESTTARVAAKIRWQSLNITNFFWFFALNPQKYNFVRYHYLLTTPLAGSLFRASKRKTWALTIIVSTPLHTDAHVRFSAGALPDTCRHAISIYMHPDTQTRFSLK